MSRTVVFLSTAFPHPISEFLTERGYYVLEALSVSEALHLADSPPVEAIIVAPGGEWYGLEDLRQRVLLDLNIHATAPEVFFELCHLFPTEPPSVQ